MDLNVAWFVLVGLLFTVYAILDGFDLGVGVLFPFLGKGEKDRATMLQAIGPVWDGNEVWLLTGGGALFAAFPHVYATVFSGFYLAMMLVVFALIFRAVSMEFRHDARWRRFWDGAFAVGSTVPALLFGVAVGNIARGIPLDAEMHFTGTFWTLLNPFALLIGLLGLAMFVVQGAAYLTLKTQGTLQGRARAALKTAQIAFAALLAVSTVAAALVRGDVFGRPLAWLGWGLAAGATAGGWWAARQRRDGQAFLASSAAIVGLMGMLGASLFPNMAPALGDPALSLTIRNASSSPRTLSVMLVIAGVGLPLVVGYTAFIYRVFKGKVRLGEEGY
ncbi:MAG: cytochrome d ubiquinol oxidase subunit II [Chloroflexi bacterium]|nr:cytochrome d ubiquinol oxidase subunit II [Chloroflexota bacterium]